MYKIGSRICEEGFISNTGISKVFLSQKLARRVAQRIATVSSKLFSKTAISKLLLGTKLY